MANATIVSKIYYIGDERVSEQLYRVNLQNDKYFKVKPGNVKNNYAVIIESFYGTPLEEIAEIVEGCFIKESNFFKSVSEIFKCKRIIRLEYNHVSIIISAKTSAKTIVKRWKKQEELLFKGIYYIIGVRKIKPKEKYDGICFVLAESEKEAIKKVERGFVSCDCTCFGKYNKKENTFLLYNADEYLEIEKMCRIED